jgi:hypothetical protein
MKQDVHHRVQLLKAELQAALDDETVPLSTWVSSLGPRLSALAKVLGQALPGLADARMGACSYDGGCIITTKAQCDDDALHGVFSPGVDCQGNPLP